MLIDVSHCVDPNHKRGPPKGCGNLIVDTGSSLNRTDGLRYIKVLERRVEAVQGVLGAIASSTRPDAQSIVAELSEDPISAQVLHLVRTSQSLPSYEVDTRSRRGEGSSNESRHSRRDREHMASPDSIGMLCSTTPPNLHRFTYFIKDSWPLVSTDWKPRVVLGMRAMDELSQGVAGVSQVWSDQYLHYVLSTD